MTPAVKQQQSPNALLYGCSEHDAEILYFAGFMAPDPFVALSIRGQRIGLFSALELGRARQEARLDQVLSMADCQQYACRIFKCRAPTLAQTIAALSKRFRVSRFAVPENFPLGLATALQRLGVTLVPRSAPFFPQRLIKSEDEVTALQAANRISAAGIRIAQKILEKTKIKQRKLHYQGRLLTSEILRAEIDKACLEQGGVAQGTIAAGGDQACNPHHAGSGPLRANELIIVDVFPRSSRTGYYGDMTRTFLRGQASPEQAALVAQVKAAQKLAINAMAAQVAASKIYRQVCDYFDKAGLPTHANANPPTGFFHSVGHGLGLEVHEPLRLGPKGPRLKSGMVVTVEPGLYYPGIGGVRLEDVVCVRDGGCDLLSHCNYRWHLR